jgi:protein-arginine kinase activator protein McsA
MICERCHEREATVHVTEVYAEAEADAEPMKKVNLGEPCCRETRPGLLESAERSNPPPRTRRSEGSDPK